MAALCFAPGIGQSARTSTVPAIAWPMYQFRPDHNAVFAEPRWRFNWRFDTRGRIGGGISIVGSTMYVESFDKHLYAVNVRTGSTLWSAPLSNVAMNTPLVASGLVYAGTGNNTIAGDNGDSYVMGIPGGDFIDAFAGSNGAPEWRYHTTGEDMPTGAIANAGSKPVFIFSNGDGHARGLEASTGVLLFESPMNGSASMGSLALHDGLAFGTSTTFAKFIIANFNNPTAMRFRAWTWAIAPDGQYAWNAPYGGSNSSPTVGGGRVFVEGTAYRVGERDPKSTIWRAEVDALNERSGALAWQRFSAAGPYPQGGSNENAIAGLYVNGLFFDSILYTHSFAAFDAQDGAIVWQTPLDAAVKMSAIEQGNRLYFGDIHGTFYVVDAKSGSILHRIAFPQIFSTSPPVIVGDTIFIPNGNAVYATPLDEVDNGTYVPLKP